MFGYQFMVNFMSCELKKLRGSSGFRDSLVFIRRGGGLLRGLCFRLPLPSGSPSQTAGAQLLPVPLCFLPSLLFCPQFLCLKNIRTFLSTCCEKFGLKRSELFEAFDLFDVQDFGKVSWAHRAHRLGLSLFP